MSTIDSCTDLKDNCDLFCSAISKTVKGNKEDFLEEKVTKLLDDKREFRTRVGL